MLLGLVERFYEPLDGLVLLDDTDLSTYEPGWLHGQIGYVSQEPGARLPSSPPRTLPACNIPVGTRRCSPDKRVKDACNPKP